MTSLKTKKRVSKGYSFEASLASIYSNLTNNQLVDKFYSLKEEKQSSLISDQLATALKMVKRELIKRGLEIA